MFSAECGSFFVTEPISIFTVRPTNLNTTLQMWEKCSKHLHFSYTFLSRYLEQPSKHLKSSLKNRKFVKTLFGPDKIWLESFIFWVIIIIKTTLGEEIWVGFCFPRSIYSQLTLNLLTLRGEHYCQHFYIQKCRSIFKSMLDHIFQVFLFLWVKMLSCKLHLWDSLGKN